MSHTARYHDLRAFLSDLEARGELRRIQAQIDPQLEITEILIELRLARELAELSQQEVELASALVRAENRRFEEGASDFFLVNIREETEAGARIEALTAALRDLVELGASPRACCSPVRDRSTAAKWVARW